tara:strand:- start:231 stop:467 length:237 start_codon:yes stop_codon:yes gene_type:complete
VCVSVLGEVLPNETCVNALYAGLVAAVTLLTPLKVAIDKSSIKQVQTFGYQLFNISSCEPEVGFVMVIIAYVDVVDIE